MNKILINPKAKKRIRIELGKTLKNCRLKARNDAIKNYLKGIGSRENRYDRKDVILGISSYYTRSQISNSIGKGTNSLSRYESGETTIDIYTLVQLSVYYDINFSELIPNSFDEFDKEKLNPNSRFEY